MRLEDLMLYQECLVFEKKVYNLLEKLNPFEKETTGKSMINSSDSISSNIASGYGRYFFKEKKHYCYISRGKLLETKGWLIKCKEREFIDTPIYDELIEFAEKINRMLNAYIRSIGKKKESDSVSSDCKADNHNSFEKNIKKEEFNGNSFTAEADDFFENV